MNTSSNASIQLYTLYYIFPWSIIYIRYFIKDWSFIVDMIMWMIYIPICEFTY